MGFEGIGIWELLLILLIVVLLFGTKKLKNVGGDLGSALKSFRSAMRDEEEHPHTGSRPDEPRDSLSANRDESADAQFSGSTREKAEEAGKKSG